MSSINITPQVVANAMNLDDGVIIAHGAKLNKVRASSTAKFEHMVDATCLVDAGDLAFYRETFKGDADAMARQINKDGES